MDSDGELILREGRRRREENDIDDDERRERRRRRMGRTEEAREEYDRISAMMIEESRRSSAQFEEEAARERQEEEEQKKWDPASKRAMVALEVPTVGETREQDCAICLEEFVDGGKKLRKMPCSHSFHQRCIFDWLERDRRCSICRSALESSRREEEQEQAAASAS